jgi:hypothetical protein
MLLNIADVSGGGVSLMNSRRTKLTYHLTDITRNRKTILDGDMKASEGSDTDSLKITKVISQAVLKNLKQSRSVRQEETQP